MKTIKTALIFLPILLSFISYEAYALSCTPYKDRIIAQCKDLICSDVIFVHDIELNNRCGRRPEIIKTPTWAKSVVEYELKAHNFSNEEGVYQLVLFKKKYLPNKTFKDIKEYSEIVESNVTSYHAKKTIRQFRRFEKLDTTSFTTVQQHWKSKAQDQYRKFIIWKVTNWSILIVSFILLLFSLLWFIQWIKRTKKVRWLVLSLIIQTLIVYYTVETFVNSASYIYMIPLLGILMPGIWLVEINAIY